jgi:quinol monooxygenase YgiN
LVGKRRAARHPGAQSKPQLAAGLGAGQGRSAGPKQPRRTSAKRDAAGENRRSAIDERRAVILELADFRIPPGKQAEFDDAIRRGVETVIAQARGFRGYEVHQGVESPERYVLMISWETLENHTVDFRQGPLFAQWRAIVGPYFAQPPVVEHFKPVAKSAA